LSRNTASLSSADTRTQTDRRGGDTGHPPLSEGSRDREVSSKATPSRRVVIQLSKTAGPFLGPSATDAAPPCFAVPRVVVDLAPSPGGWGLNQGPPWVLRSDQIEHAKQDSQPRRRNSRSGPQTSRAGSRNPMFLGRSSKKLGAQTKAPSRRHSQSCPRSAARTPGQRQAPSTRGRPTVRAFFWRARGASRRLLQERIGPDVRASNHDRAVGGSSRRGYS